jgi:hypothetical protein
MWNVQCLQIGQCQCMNASYVLNVNGTMCLQQEVSETRIKNGKMKIYLIEISSKLSLGNVLMLTCAQNQPIARYFQK